MKGKIIIILILMMLMVCSIFSSANQINSGIEKNNPIGKLTYDYHDLYKYPPWEKNDEYTENINGDVVTTASSTKTTGNAQVKCHFENWGHGEEGKAGFRHWIEWTSPISVDNAVIIIDYNFDAEVKVSSVNALGDSAKVKIWFTFFVNDIEKDNVIVDWSVSGAFNQEHTWTNEYSYANIHTPLEKGTTYEIGVESHAYAYADMTAGDEILSKAKVSNSWENQGDDTQINIRWEDRPPEKPSKPSGKTNVKCKETATYKTSTTDPDLEQIYYQWSFGDTGSSGWIGPYEQGETASYDHTWWRLEGCYEVKVKAKGSLVASAQSEWSDSLFVTVKKSKSKDAYILNNLENIFIQFPIFQQILNL